MNRRPRAFPFLRWVAAAGPALLLAFLIFHAAERGIADLHGRQVLAQIAVWEKARKPVAIAEWRKALAVAKSAERLTPRSPDVAENLGRLHDWGAFARDPTHIVTVAFRQQALKYFREAAQRRPTSGYTWANIAQQKAALGAIDSEFTRALQLAAMLAPWEPDVQFIITDAGLWRWAMLDGASRETVRQAASRGLTRHAKQISDIARARGRSDILCSLPTASQLPGLVCK